LMESLDGLLEVVALDEAHGVEGPAVRIRAQAIDRHDAGVLQPAGDLRLQHKAAPAVLAVGVLGADLLEGDLAVQLRTVGGEALARPAPGVRPQDPVTQAGRRCGRGMIADRSRSWRLARAANVGQAGLYVVIGDLLQVVPEGGGG